MIVSFQHHKQTENKKMALKQVQLSKKSNDQLEELCQQRFENDDLYMKKHVVADAIAYLHKKEIRK